VLAHNGFEQLLSSAQVSLQLLTEQQQVQPKRELGTS
jgi:hypothetical protein